MTKEAEMATLLRAEQTLTAILTGGIYTSEEVGIEGIHRGEEDPDDTHYSPTAQAFDEDGYLKPCALVRELGETPMPRTQTPGQGFEAVSMLVQIYLYQDEGYDQIDLARNIIFGLVNNKRLGRSYPVYRDSESSYTYSVGPVENAITKLMTWKVVYTKQ